jgi:AraC-like DNA-binding protein
MKRDSHQKVDFIALGFSLGEFPATKMPRPHRHNEIEMTILNQGSIKYMFGGSRVTISAGALCVRWAAIPHQCIDSDPGGVQYSLKIPLAWFLQWQLPESFVKSLLGGAMLIDREPDEGCSDWAMFRRWNAMLRDNAPEHRRIVVLEAEARLRRIALNVMSDARQSTIGEVTRGRLGKVEKMAVFVAGSYTGNIGIADIARAAGLHPNSAMRLFRKACGMTLLEYVTLHRVWHAQRLLAATDLKIRHVAADSGFHSTSRFYAAFEGIVGQLPRDYRMSISSRSS